MSRPPSQADLGQDAPREGERPSFFRGHALFWVTAVLICLFDLGTKSWIFDRLDVDASRFESYEEFQRYHRVHQPRENLLGEQVSLVALLNPGMMWGFGHEHPEVLRIGRILAVIVILYLLRGLGRRQHVSKLALGGILGGAVGNIYDSIRFVGVRDFLEVDLDFWIFDPFPAFNVADSAICVGVVVLAIGLLLGGASCETTATVVADEPAPPEPEA